MTGDGPTPDGMRAGPRRLRLSRRLMGAARHPDRRTDRTGEMPVGDLIARLGDRSFGWALILFSLLNLLPVPFGSNLILAIPLIVVTAQMALGRQALWLPDRLASRRIGMRGFRKLVLRAGPLLRPVDRLVQPRLMLMFSPVFERSLGVAFLVLSIAVFLPLPFAAYLPAIALLLAGIGIVERDGLVLIVSLALGAVAVAVSVAIGAMVLAGATALST